MIVLVILGGVLAVVLGAAWRLDRKAAAQGLKYVPTRRRSLFGHRTTMVLVERDDDVDEEQRRQALAERLYEEQRQDRQRRRGL